MRAAIERRGVAVVVVPGEIFRQHSTSGGRASRPIRRTVVARSGRARHDLAAAADVLNAAERVTILAGAGCAGAHDELLAIAERLQAPVVHALRGKEWVEYDNPYDVGMTGLLGFPSGYRAMEHCDALLMLGTDFPYRDLLSRARPGSCRSTSAARTSAAGSRSTSPLVGTVKDTVTALLPRLRDGPRRRSICTG